MNGTQNRISSSLFNPPCNPVSGALRESRALRWKTCLLGALACVTLLGPHARAGENDRRQKVIDFEDEVVEGLNKRPLDSLSQISERDKRRKRPHLYRKRGGFRSEIAETLRVLRYAP